MMESTTLTTTATPATVDLDDPSNTHNNRHNNQQQLVQNNNNNNFNTANTATTTTTTMTNTTRQEQNHHHHHSRNDQFFLTERLVGDVIVGTIVTAGIAPFLTVVDQAIVESSAGTKTMTQSALDNIRFILRNPIQYIKSPTFLLMWSVYAATYSTANGFKTLQDHQQYKNNNRRSHNAPANQQSDGFGKVGIFLGTTFVNSSASMMKDRAYAQMFGSGGGAGAASNNSFPKSSYMFWTLRDLSVIGSSFILPDLVATKLSTDYGMDKDRTLSYCQLTLPVLTQVIAGPLHFLGLDFYNRRDLNPLYANANNRRWLVFQDRLIQLTHNFTPVVLARMARIAPGYGIGGVYNTKFRNVWKNYVSEREVEQHTVVGSTSANANATIGRRLSTFFHGMKAKYI